MRLGAVPGSPPPQTCRQPMFTDVNSPCQIARSSRREPCVWPEMLIACGYLFSTLRFSLMPRPLRVVPVGGWCANTNTGLPGCDATASASILSNRFQSTPHDPYSCGITTYG